MEVCQIKLQEAIDGRMSGISHFENGWKYFIYS